MSPRRVLVATYYYPPQPGSGSSRWAAMVSHLRRAGHQVTVVTAAPPGHRPGREGDVLRTANLNSSPLLRRVLLRSKPAAGATAGVPAAGGTLPPLLWKGIVPDPWLVTWNPTAWRAIRRLHAERPYDALITSSPAHSTHLLGLWFGRDRPAWIADFRDGWGFEPLLPPFPTPPQRALDRSLERRVVQGADVVVAVTRPIAEDLGVRLGVAAEHLPNGWDPEQTVAPPPAPARPEGHLRLLHAGAMSGAWGRNPRALLIALRRLLAERPEAAGRIELVLAGNLEPADRAMLDEFADLEGVICHLGYIPREQALALQRAADLLVLITSRNRGEATGKLYEYMAAARPVLALAEGNEAARIVRETNIGVAVPPEDAEAIAAVLLRALDGELQRSYAPRGIEAYAYPALAERMTALLETAIERRARARGAV